MDFPDQADIRARLERWFTAGLRAVDPVAATRRALDREPAPDVAPAIIATGKASVGMARAAVEWLASHGMEPFGGVVVHHEVVERPHHALSVVHGDHPVPGAGSLVAADALGAFIATIPEATPVHVFLSGGTSSLLAAPVTGVTPLELQDAFAQFHTLGLDIVAMNSLRRRLTRWSNGRLAAALAPRHVQAWVISDVVGNDLATIASGPLVAGDPPDPNIIALLTNAVPQLPESIRAALLRTEPVADDAIAHQVVADASMARAAVVAAAEADGVRAIAHREMLVGDARRAGERLAHWIHNEVRRHRLPDRNSGVLVTPVPREGVIHVWASETTVSLPAGHGMGGRAQQFALAAAQQIADLGWPGAATVLVAGTDGRDGPTDAAGAVVDAGTAHHLENLGVELDRALERCDAYPALDAAGALLRTGGTGTNVADLVVVWLWNWY